MSFGELNSRMKDFFDSWLLLHSFDFEGEDLAEAIRRTADRRRIKPPDTITAFAPEFATAKQVQWRAFTKRLGEGRDVPHFPAAISAIAGFLSPTVQALHVGAAMPERWVAP